MRRIELNYKKEGLTQVFPILLVKNNQEDAWLFGFWKWNIAIVKGRNIVPIDFIKEQNDFLRFSSNMLDEKTGRSRSKIKLTERQKKNLIMVVGAVAIGIVGLYVFQKYRNRK